MRSFLRLVILGTTAFLLLAMEIVLRWPVLLAIVLPLSLLIIVWACWNLVHRKIDIQLLQFGLTPVLYALSGWSVLIFIANDSLQQSIIFTTVILSYVYFQVSFFYLHVRPRYQAHSLENIANYLHVLIVFFLSLSAFMVMVFTNFNGWVLQNINNVIGAVNESFFLDLNIDSWLFALFLAVTAGFLSYQLCAISAIPWERSKTTVGVVSLIIFELFIAVSFLPASASVMAALVALGYYLMVGLGRNWLLEIKEPRVLWRYLTITIVSVMIILLTAKWV